MLWPIWNLFCAASETVSGDFIRQKIRCDSNSDDDVGGARPATVKWLDRAVVNGAALRLRPAGFHPSRKRSALSAFGDPVCHGARGLRPPRAQGIPTRSAASARLPFGLFSFLW